MMESNPLYYSYCDGHAYPFFPTDEDRVNSVWRARERQEDARNRERQMEYYKKTGGL